MSACNINNNNILMEDLTIECTMCGASFRTEKEYSEHKCTENDPSGLLIKQEPEDDDDFSFHQEESEEIVNEIDPLTVQPYDLLAIKEENADIEVDELDREQLVEQVEETTVRDRGSALADSCLSHFNCKLCGANFTVRETFRAHFQTQHSSYRPYECNVCKKKFLHKHYVSLHMRVHTGEKPYECKLCPKAYSHKTSYTIHMRIHNGIRPYSCNICGKKCYDKSGLTSHMRSHTKETPYQCEVCGRRFTHSKSLLVHRRNHTGEKPYVCTYCGKAFRHWHKHKIHIRLHTGERPYKCKICGKGFPRNDEVSRHMRSHQGIKSFKCSICGVYCATQASITGHIDLHHSNLKSDSSELPEKTLVKDSKSGILGTKVPEPRSMYRKVTEIPKSNLQSATASTSEEDNKINSISQLQTRVIEITSKETPFTLNKRHAKSLKKGSNFGGNQGNYDSDINDQEKSLSPKEFLDWQQRMLTNQGLIVKSYSAKKNAAVSSKIKNNVGDSDAVNNVVVNNTSKQTTILKTVAAKANSQSKPQYLLLTQGEGQNATKILLPLNIGSVTTQKQVKIPSVQMISPPVQKEGKVVTNPPKQPVYLMRSNQLANHMKSPTMTNQPFFLVSNNLGQKMIILTPNNSLMGLKNDAAPNITIKEEPEDDSLPSGLESSPMNITIKKEKDSDDSQTNFCNIVIKQESEV